MKRNCKTCTLNTTNDTVETCKRMCYLRYSKQRNKRICDLEQEIQQLKQILNEIKEMLKEVCMEECSFDWNKTSKKHCGDCDCRYGQILQKISECEGNNE